ncbi:LamG-like jellyroll fold domain-containing protein [Streptomyces sp. NPDC020681]|uniref:LamG-like jellyroll fold domain-containing protein n=1 Tax=Streptomyces sp. NPDC020681 TaxID=3365083 RepID=UPI00379AEB55
MAPTPEALVRTRIRTRLRPAVAGLSLLLAATAAPVVTAPPAAASGTQKSADALTGDEQILFRSGTAGYGCFRIPSLVRTKAGTLLAFAEGRKSPTCADRGSIDVVVRRSTNDGRTWGPVRVALAGSPADPHAPYTRGNATPVADETTGEVFLLSTSEPSTGEPGGKRLPWLQRSKDDGLSFSAPTALPRFSGADKGWYGTGPAHGVQLRNGSAKGRLVVGAYESPTPTTQYVGVLYSDDHGDTWKTSATENTYEKDVLLPGEPAVAELDDGGLYIAARNNTAAGHRTHAVSTDGGTTVPKQRIVPGLVSPQVQGSVLALRQTYRATPGDTLVFAAPSHPTNRQSMRIRYSMDRGTTWRVASAGLINDKRAGYSDMAELGDGQIGLIYEGGADFSAASLYFNRFTPGSVGVPGTFTGAVRPQPSPAAGPTTPDSDPEANDAYLAGSSSLGPGRFGQGLVLDKAGDHASLPYTPSLDPGAGDVTYSFFFRYSATTSSPQQALMWAYGFGSGKPQLWVRAQPAQDRLLAWAETDTGAVGIPLTDPGASTAYGDGAWHQLSLVRSAGQLTLSVDGGVPALATGVTGSLTDSRAKGVEGIRIGAKPDSSAGDPFTGSIDEFRVHRTALTDAQLSALRTANSAPDAEATQSVRLPFQVVDTAEVPALTQVGVEDDVSGHCADGTLLGGLPPETAGRIGRGAITVGATRPGVEVPYVPTLDVGDDDFTYTLWFSHSATAATAQSALMWAYGSASGQPSLWVRAQPAQDRLYAFAETASGPVQIALPDTGTSVAYGDGAWHLLAVSRSGNTLRVSVDGAPAAEATGLTGSLTTAANPEGVRIGSKPGSLDILTGRLDDFRLHRRALTDAELLKVAQSAAGSTGGYPADPAVLWWSMEGGHTEVHPVARPAAGPATPDSSAHCNHAFVRGGTQPSHWQGGGRFGSGLPFDGTDDGVELPYGAEEALGGGDFTVATWLKYTASPTTGSQVILWAYGMGAAERQVWLRAQPGQDRLAALVQTDTATTMLYAADGGVSAGFGDGAWHHVVLKRSGGVLSLSVDGQSLDDAPVPAGSVTYGDSFAVSGIRLGTRPDGLEHFKGSMDEFRLVRRALSEAELTSLRSSNADTGTATTVRLPFETVTTGAYARM